MKNRLIVRGDNQLKEISKYFRYEYPFLKLEFFNKPHDEFEGNVLADLLDLEETVSSCGGVGGDIELDDNMSVSELEATIKDKLNLNAQVFRRSGDVWLETMATDDWTLRFHSERAAENYKLDKTA